MTNMRVNGHTGFTLIEILIAMAIFSVIGLAATGILTTVIDSNAVSEERFAKLQRLQRTMLTMERDIQQAVAKPTRIAGEINEVVMRGGELDGSEADAIGFVRSGRHNPRNMLPRSTLQYVGYRLVEGKLERLYSNYVDNVVGYEPKVRVMLEDVNDFRVFFIPAEQDNDNDEESDWKESYTSTTLPLAVAFEIESKDFGKIRREFTLGSKS
ncbi:type II secretion system minor pseudopilin GspJ [Alteromonas sp. ASW11-130]|uniref:type II secretion system minor pseudopilin GspJ n=1 Tax=Alteromonas sp. ASW11-130 TaxID=3015775 RepID=UPI002241A309|nr:type II secretion system minor pseudopilin GspJ [Alteromonas sp. ASW11-130]MCW8093274.1 type II secretion system minor pseudopilin GspJ [Alteromonas sp. ASW11-130]